MVYKDDGKLHQLLYIEHKEKCIKIPEFRKYVQEKVGLEFIERDYSWTKGTINADYYKIIDEKKWAYSRLKYGV